MGIKAPLEKDVQKVCVAWLRAFGATAVRVNSGGMKVGKRFVRFNDQPGCSDILACLPQGGRFLACEVKRPGRDRTSAKRKAEQASFRQSIAKSGGIACVVRSLAELIADLKEEGYDVEKRH